MASSAKINNKAITIAVVGPHYAGKSTLCQLFQKKLGFKLKQEKWWKDPFRNTRPRDYFKSQLWYLLQNAKSLIEAKKKNKKGITVVLDTFHYSTLIFAKTKLNQYEFGFFRKIFSLVDSLIPYPDMLIYLHATPRFLYSVRRVDRIKKATGPQSDAQTPLEWFRTICKLNNFYFSNWKKTNIIKVDVQKIDITNEKDFNILVNKMRKKIS